MSSPSPLPTNEEALKCIDIATKAMNAKDWYKAERFLDKSIKFEFSNKA